MQKKTGRQIYCQFPLDRIIINMRAKRLAYIHSHFLKYKTLKKHIGRMGGIIY